MQRKDIQLIAMSVIFAGIFALILTMVLFNNKQSKISVPNVEVISPDFPDVSHDPSYKAVFNQNALDPTQTITIGTSQNGNPFAGGQ